MAPKLEIKFSRPDKIYRASETVTGTVTVDCKKKFYCKAIYIDLQGIGWVSLNNKKANNQRIFQQENYYSHKFSIFGNGVTPSLITSGEHSYNFAFVIPSNVPSSFEAKYGHVKHSCEAFLDPAKRRKKISKCNELFTVISEFDLNTSTIAKNPIIQNIEKKRFIWDTGKIRATIKVNRSGYVPGESMIIAAECENTSKRLIAETAAKVVQTTSFIVGDQCKITQNVVCSLKQEYQENDGICNRVTLKLPENLPSSYLKGCSLIDIGYTLHFKVTGKHGGKLFGISAPLVIGSIPLQLEENNFEQLKTNVDFTSSNPGLDFNHTDVRDEVEYARLDRRPSPTAPLSHFVQEQPMPDAPPSYEESVAAAGNAPPSYSVHPPLYTKQ